MEPRSRAVSILACVVVAAALVLAAVLRPAPGPASPAEGGGAASGPALPRLVELGSDSCDACKAMQPVLARLREDCAGRLRVDFVDIWRDESAAEPFRVSMIPTQVFLDPSGRELWRHEGFLSAPEIAARWRELGWDVGVVRDAGGSDGGFRSRLAGALTGARGLALGAAFVWGLASIALSPCHLASIPLAVAFLRRSSSAPAASALRVSSVFALGILLSLAVAGGIAVAAGTLAGDLGPWPAWLLAALLAALGLRFAGLLELDWAAPSLERFARGGVLAPLAFGFVFGLALGPCAFAFVAPLLGASFAVARTDALFAAGLLALFSLGHCAAIVAGATSLDRVQRAVAWGDSAAGAKVRVAVGVALVLAAVYLAHTAA